MKRIASLLGAAAVAFMALVGTAKADDNGGYEGVPVVEQGSYVEAMAKRAVGAPKWSKVVVPVSNPATATEPVNVRVIFSAPGLSGKVRTTWRNVTGLRPGTTGNVVRKMSTSWFGQATDVNYQVVRLERTVVQVYPGWFRVRYAPGEQIMSGVITASGGVIVRADPVNVGEDTDPGTNYPAGNVILFNQVSGKYLVAATFNGSGYTFPSIATGSWGAVPFVGNVTVVASFSDVPNGTVTGTATATFNGPASAQANAVVYTITNVTPVQPQGYPAGSIVLLNSVPGNKFLVSATFNGSGYTFPNVPNGSWGYVTGFTGSVSITARFADVPNGAVTSTATQTVTAPASSSAPAVVWTITTIAQP